MGELEIVKAYLAAIEEGRADAAFALVSPDAEQIEWPNALKPGGGRRGYEQMRADFERGLTMLSAQRYEITAALAQGGMVMIEAVWEGTLASDAGPLRSGDTMEAHCAMAFEVRNGKIAMQRNYDCFEPFAPGPSRSST